MADGQNGPPTIPSSDGLDLSGGADDGAEGQAFGAVGGLGVGSDRLVERHGVVAHQDPPAILSHSVEAHAGGLGRGDRKRVAWGKSVSVRVESGGGRPI